MPLARLLLLRGGDGGITNSFVLQVFFAGSKMFCSDYFAPLSSSSLVVVAAAAAGWLCFRGGLRRRADHPARQVHMPLLRQGHHQASGDGDLEVLRLQEDLRWGRLHPQVSQVPRLLCLLAC